MTGTLESQIDNARLCRLNYMAPFRAVIVTGDAKQAQYWSDQLNRSRRRNIGREALEDKLGFPVVTFERGRKGNFLGTLQAYRDVFLRGRHPEADLAQVDQLVMLLGSGTRLSPITQRLQNIKAACAMPNGLASSVDYTIGEAAIRSTAPLIDQLKAAKFDGLVVRWGDEVIVPEKAFALMEDVGDFDVLRFGWGAQPTEGLASQKEWLLASVETGRVHRDVSRQNLTALQETFEAAREEGLTPFVNLGSFAISHAFLRLACEIFDSEIDASRAKVNWDPYFWIALQSESLAEWQSNGAKLTAAGISGFKELEDSVPDFYALVSRLRENFEVQFGRTISVGVLDFGRPYWVDAGSHISLRRFFDDIFSSSLEGSVARELVGFPDSLALGESFVADSKVAEGAEIRNSVIVGSTVRSSDSHVDRAIVVASDCGKVRVEKGGVVIDCHSESLEVHSPRGVAYGVEGSAEVGGDEVISTVRLRQGDLTLKYEMSMGHISDETFHAAISGNPVSFADAAASLRD